MNQKSELEPCFAKLLRLGQGYHQLRCLSVLMSSTIASTWFGSARSYCAMKTCEALAFVLSTEKIGCQHFEPLWIFLQRPHKFWETTILTHSCLWNVFNLAAITKLCSENLCNRLVCKASLLKALFNRSFSISCSVMLFTILLFQVCLLDFVQFSLQEIWRLLLQVFSPSIQLTLHVTRLWFDRWHLMQQWTPFWQRPFVTSALQPDFKLKAQHMACPLGSFCG